MHLCAAKCCDDKDGSIDYVQGCIERCSAPVTKSQRYVTNELEDFQGRLQRCVMVNLTYSLIIHFLHLSSVCPYTLILH